MKGTAKFYTLAAALIATVVFAAAITIPGGNHDDTGIPNFSKEKPSKFLQFGCSFPLPIHCFGADMPIHSHGTICRR
ncbi:hypothetical protein CK203_107959 [Vitis vinifera]|uniref:PGG domain-containing protein n=1 Tax=Vitis vinifera TaxID=29760 RepID=A0A438BQZ3_VITVI|nr:hypothetical protein CK203_107959 [Vitis vinifera]